MFFGKSTKEIGDYGERLAAKHLAKQGYKIICKNYHSAHGEIDIIAQNKDFLVFVEVKTRKDNEKYFDDYGLPAEAVDRKKQQHIIFTAKKFLQSNQTDKPMRFDVIEVFLNSTTKINHIEDAFIL